MRKLKFLLALVILCGNVMLAQAQGSTSFGETMRSNGRIYVVVAVMLTILIGIVIYLIRLDRKISRAEKD